MDRHPAEPDIITFLTTTNAVPGHSISSFIRRTLEELGRGILTTYDPIIFCSRAEALATRNALQEAQRKYQGIISAVRRVTEDIWVRIFSFNAGEANELLQYRTVFRSWFRSANHPTLWTSFTVELYHDQDFDRVRVNHLEDILNHFTHVRSLLLDLNIRYDSLPANALNIGRCDVELLPDKTKWRSLTTGADLLRIIMRPESGFFFNSLEEVVVCSGAGGEGVGDVKGVSMLDLPSLQSLTMNVSDGVNIESITVPWHQLTHLSLDVKSSDAADYLEILYKCRHNLESCEIMLNGSPYPPRFFPYHFETRLTMAKLKRFRLMGKECPALFLSFLLMPELKVFEIGWGEGDSRAQSSPSAARNDLRMWLGKRIAHFVKSSGCRIKLFWIQASDIRVGDLDEAFAAMKESASDVALWIAPSPSMPYTNNRELQTNAYNAQEDRNIQMENCGEVHALRHQHLPQLHNCQCPLIHSHCIPIAHKRLTVAETYYYEEHDCVRYWD